MRPVVRVGVGGELVECELHDVSQNGVAFVWPKDPAPEIESPLEDVTVSFDAHEAYHGNARVRSVRESEGRTLVGVSFLDSLMNIDDVLALRDVKAWTGLGATGVPLSARPWHTPGYDRFKALVAELRLFLEDAKDYLGRLESSLPWHVAQGDHESPARAALVSRVRTEFAAELIRYSELIDVEARKASPAELEALQDYSRRHIHDLLLEAPCMHRALYKPRGYPGDFEIMRFMYENQFAGSTLFAKAVSLAILTTRPGESVRARKDLVKRRLSDLIDARAAGGGEARILSIAAGPAQEVYELLKERAQLPTPVEIVLFDQDPGALTFAYGRIMRLLAERRDRSTKVVYLHDSIKRLLKDPAIFADFGTFDAIFACGLFDYLEVRVGSALVRNLYPNLAPGGTLMVGNMVPECPNRWFMELHLEWFLKYKTRDELREMARAGAPSAHVEIVEEPTGINPFAALTRR